MHLTILAEAGATAHHFCEILSLDGGLLDEQDVQQPHAEMLGAILSAALAHAPADTQFLRLGYFLNGHKVYDETWGWARTSGDEQQIVLPSGQSLALLEHKACNIEKLQLDTLRSFRN